MYRLKLLNRRFIITYPAFLVATFLIIIYPSCQPKSLINKTDLEREGIMKPAISAKYSNYDAREVNGKIEMLEPKDDGVLTPFSEIKKFDSKGNIIEIASYQKNGRLWQKEIFEFNENNNLILHKESVVANVFENSNEFNIRHEAAYKYDDKGRLISVTGRYPTGDFLFTPKRMRYVENYNHDIEYPYVVCEIATEFEDGTVKQSKRKELTDEKRNLTERISISENYTSRSKTYYYKNKIVDSNTVDNGNEVSNYVTLFELDKYGNYTRNSNYKFQYEYDKYGSWIKCTEYDPKGVAYKVVVREITYLNDK
ncbi:MAG: hypothetical protein HYI21_00385 [Sediminibacterium sp. Gen4]|uniref:hypothetical protein n=1 Tax=unclassified Sediminibacterium TaxID=2635961 RepID=UPI0015C1A90C|nr:MULTISPECIES: hypothetical protein [unclassified Sediminibacterium]MBW0161804.1 hypothetical protein [Sediminibacterium sp.]MBW0165009.1 hypothetical protein [Sediminibacterium sp.]NWK64464.1 hypothetical protein [Sediminibacterium sp. Gen4]